ncbi:MAG TPA: DUF1992 domain-containing protein [Actinocrinis sp.]|nr:DUF1992 domain-containing protein [Actinocrinis sp.]
MSDWQSRFESLVDRQIREAEERGEFDGLPGAGKPLRALDRPYTDDWWLNDLIEREKIGSHALPPALALRKEAQDLMASLPTRYSQAAVRDAVADYNERAVQVMRNPQRGPAAVVHLLDADEVVRAWRSQRHAG